MRNAHVGGHCPASSLPRASQAKRHLELLYQHLLAQPRDSAFGALGLMEQDGGVQYFLYDEDSYEFQPANAIVLLRAVGGILRAPDIRLVQSQAGRGKHASPAGGGRHAPASRGSEGPATASGSGGPGNAELPYGGDMMAAMRAKDRPAIKAIMAARQAGANGR